MKHLLVIVLAGLLMISFDAFSREYVSVGGVITDYNVPFPDNLVLDDNAKGYEVAVGLPLPLPWLSVEIALSDNGTSRRSIGPATFELDSESLAVLFKGAWTIATIGGHPLKAVTRLGFSATQFRAIETTSGISNTDTDVGLAYGAGLNLSLSPHWAIEADYLQRQHQVNIIPLASSAYHMNQAMAKVVYTF